MTDSAKVQEFKEYGNVAYSNGDYRQAIFMFSKALELRPTTDTEAILYSNRSAAYCLLEDYERALQDADKVLALNPKWTKGYSRKGAALHQSKRYEEAIQAFKQGLELDPKNEMLQKWLEDSSKAKHDNELRCFDNEVKAGTHEQMKLAGKLPKMGKVVWHLEIMKDKIWLVDPPKPPFRPRSLFIMDSEKLMMLHMLAHPTRDSISLDELLNFILSTMFRHSCIPHVVEFSDYTLEVVLADQLQSLGVQFRTVSLSPEKQRFFEETVRGFEEKESQQWGSNHKFGGVLKQRQQPGLSSVPGVTIPFLKAFMSAAAKFYRSKVYLYYTKSVGIRVEGADEMKVALMTRNSLGQYGVAQTTLEASSPDDCGVSSCVFADISNLPFDDADLYEKHGWDVCEDKYVLPVMHSTTSNARPSYSDLQWYEIAFKSLTLLLCNTFTDPTYVPSGSICCRCTIYTNAGKIRTIVTIPASTDTAADFTLEEAKPVPAKEKTGAISPPASTITPNSNPPPSSSSPTPPPRASTGKAAPKGPHKTPSAEPQHPAPAPAPIAPTTTPIVSPAAAPVTKREVHISEVPPPAFALQSSNESRPEHKFEKAEHHHGRGDRRRWRSAAFSVGEQRREWTVEKRERIHMLSKLEDIIIESKSKDGSTKLQHLNSQLTAKNDFIQQQHDLIKQLQATISHQQERIHALEAMTGDVTLGNTEKILYELSVLRQIVSNNPTAIKAAHPTERLYVVEESDKAPKPKHSKTEVAAPAAKSSTGKVRSRALTQPQKDAKSMQNKSSSEASSIVSVAGAALIRPPSPVGRDHPSSMTFSPAAQHQQESITFSKSSFTHSDIATSATHSYHTLRRMSGPFSPSHQVYTQPSAISHPMPRATHQPTPLQVAGASAFGSPAVRSRSPQDLSEQEYLSEANVCF